MLSIRLYKNSR